MKTNNTKNANNVRLIDTIVTDNGKINMAKLVAAITANGVSSKDKVDVFASVYCVAKRRDLLNFTDWRVMERLFDWELDVPEKEAIIRKVDWEGAHITFPRDIAYDTDNKENIGFYVDVYDILGNSERAVSLNWYSKRLSKEYQAKVNFL